VIGREQPGKNAQNAWFPGTKNKRRTSGFLFYMSPRLRQRRVLYRTLTFKNKENIMVATATQKDVLQQNFEAGTPTIENSCLQGANNKQKKGIATKRWHRNLPVNEG
jgi:hypothetical protein